MLITSATPFKPMLFHDNGDAWIPDRTQLVVLSDPILASRLDDGGVDAIAPRGTWLRQHAEALEGKVVVVAGFNSEQRWVADCARSLAGVAEEVRLLPLERVADSLIDRRFDPAVRGRLREEVRSARFVHGDCRQIRVVEGLGDDSPLEHRSRWVLGPLLPRGSATLLSGRSRDEAAQVALLLGLCVAAGRGLAGMQPSPGGVTIVSPRRPAEVIRHALAQLAAANGLLQSGAERNLRIVDLSEVDPTLDLGRFEGLNEGRTSAMDELLRVMGSTELLIIDSVQATCGAGSQDHSAVRAFVSGLERIARARQCGLVLVDECDSRSSTWGVPSILLRQAVDNLVACSGEGRRIEITHERHGLLEGAAPFQLWRAKPRTAQLVIVSEDLRREQEQADDGQVYRGLHALFESGERVSTAATGPRSAPKLFERLDDFAFDPSSKDGRDRILAAVLRLERARRIRRCPGRNGSPGTWEPY